MRNPLLPPHSPRPRSLRGGGTLGWLWRGPAALAKPARCLTPRGVPGPWGEYPVLCTQARCPVPGEVTWDVVACPQGRSLHLYTPGIVPRGTMSCPWGGSLLPYAPEKCPGQDALSPGKVPRAPTAPRPVPEDAPCYPASREGSRCLIRGYPGHRETRSIPREGPRSAMPVTLGGTRCTVPHPRGSSLHPRKAPGALFPEPHSRGCPLHPGKALGTPKPHPRRHPPLLLRPICPSLGGRLPCPPARRPSGPRRRTGKGSCPTAASPASCPSP